MLFNSYPFIFGFAPIAALVFFALGRRRHELAAAWLVAASLFFYGWWNPRYVALLVGSIAVNYALGTRIARAAGMGQLARGRALLTAGVVLDVLVLAYYKYAGFFLHTVDALAGTRWGIGEVVLPLGISFFTFTQIAYLVDASRGEVAHPRLVHYALFVTYFPHLVAGPILHHREMMPQFARAAIYRPHAEHMAVGLTLFAMGLAKKVLIADTVSAYATAAFAATARGEAVSFTAAWGGALAYTFQLYFDFSGYSDMAVGLSRIFGIHLPLNFNSPYKAESIIDFWRRWHMSLSRFLRDYVYVPLGGSRRGPVRRQVNLLLTMLVGGLWHGAGWTFLAWGALHGLYLVVNHGWRAARGVRPRSTRAGRVCARLLTFLAVVVAWVPFRAADFHAAWRMLRGMAGADGFALPPAFADVGASLVLAPVLADLGWVARPGLVLVLILTGLLAIAWLAPNTQQILGRYNRALDPYPSAAAPRPPAIEWRPTPATAALTGLVFFLCLLALLSESPSEFLYFQF